MYFSTCEIYNNSISISEYNVLFGFSLTTTVLSLIISVNVLFHLPKKVTNNEIVLSPTSVERSDHWMYEPVTPGTNPTAPEQNSTIMDQNPTPPGQNPAPPDQIHASPDKIYAPTHLNPTPTPQNSSVPPLKLTASGMIQRSISKGLNRSLSIIRSEENKEEDIVLQNYHPLNLENQEDHSIRDDDHKLSTTYVCEQPERGDNQRTLMTIYNNKPKVMTVRAPNYAPPPRVPSAFKTPKRTFVRDYVPPISTMDNRKRFKLSR